MKAIINKLMDCTTIFEVNKIVEENMELFIEDNFMKNFAIKTKNRINTVTRNKKANRSGMLN